MNTTVSVKVSLEIDGVAIGSGRFGTEAAATVYFLSHRLEEWGLSLPSYQPGHVLGESLNLRG